MTSHGTQYGNKTALVTGATSGIGLGIAKALAKDGASVIINGLGDSDEINAALNAIGHDACYMLCDMADPSAINTMMDDIGGVDILINNAGVQYVAPIEDFPPHEWDRVIAINLSAAFHTTRRAIKTMRENGWGRIVNIASAHGTVASPHKSAYVAAKHAILGLTKTVALEVAQAGITVNAISPGYVLTPLVERQIPATAQARNMSQRDVIDKVMLANQPTKQFVEIDHIAAAACYLCSDAAASITGSNLSIDAGWTAQ